MDRFFTSMVLAFARGIGYGLARMFLRDIEHDAKRIGNG